MIDALFCKKMFPRSLFVKNVWMTKKKLHLQRFCFWTAASKRQRVLTAILA
jgi:hypothetical protein